MRETCRRRPRRTRPRPRSPGSGAAARRRDNEIRVLPASLYSRAVVDDLFDVLPGKEGAEPAGDELVTIVLRLHVQPGGGRSAVTGRYGDAVKVKVPAPP